MTSDISQTLGSNEPDHGLDVPDGTAPETTASVSQVLEEPILRG